MIGQWNVNGLIYRKPDLQLFLRDTNCKIMCIQETRLKENMNFYLNSFTVLRKDYTGGQIASGGVCLLISNEYTFNEINLNTDLQAVAATIFGPFKFTVCSLYLPPNVTFSIDQLVHLTQQLPEPLLLLGDFNGHNILWHSTETDTRGRLIEAFLGATNLCIINGNSPTHFCSATGKHSYIDLSLSSPQILSRIEWRVSDDLYGSDHYPIVIDIIGRQPPPPRPSRWNTKEADWSKYQNLAQLNHLNFSLTNINELYLELTNALLSAAEKSIPKTKPTTGKIPVPWWNNVCSEAVKARKRALRRFKRHPCDEHLRVYLQSRSEARRTICSARRESWINFVSSINCHTPSSEVWNAIRKISGHYKRSFINNIKHNDNIVTDTEEIANLFGAHQEKVSSNQNYSPNFLRIKDEAESLPLEIFVDPLNPLNRELTYLEFSEALNSRKDTAPGPDNIIIGMIKHLTVENKLIILKFLNKVFTSDNFPEIWTKSIGFPLLKKEKPPNEISSYRMISLTCSLCKLLEKMVIKRILWYKEKNGLHHPWQSGFKAGRSTRDNLVRLESEVLEAFNAKKKLVAVFIDIKCAFDCVWRRYILNSYSQMGIQGHILRFLKNFLYKRTFRIQIGNCLSRDFIQENGVPQGSVVSPDCFSTGLDPVLDEVEEPVRSMLLADDMVVYCTGKSVQEILMHLQPALDRVTKWLSDHGFTISVQKSVAVCFSPRKILNPPPIYINNNELNYNDSTSFLGLTFDSRLNWCAHIKNLKSKCIRATNILKMLSNTAWGADRSSMLMLYRSLIRSKMDYGCAVYGSATPRTLSMLNSVHHSGLRLALGAFRSSPAISLLAESGEPPLDSRRDLLLLRYYYSLLSSPTHPLYTILSEPNLRPLRIRRLSFLRRARDLSAKYCPQIPQILHRTVSAKPPWTFTPLRSNLTLTKYIKKDTSPIFFLNEFKKVYNSLPAANRIFSDGSKSNEGVGSAFIIDGRNYMFSLPSISSVYTAELLAINKALNIIMPTSSTIILFTDSLSTLLSLSNYFTTNPLILDTLNAIETLNNNGIRVIFTWIPSHCGIKYNEEVDKLAKKAIKDGIVYNKIPLNDVKAFAKTQVLDHWAEEWHSVRENKLREVKPTAKAWASSTNNDRKREVIIARLRIGHTRLTHGHLMAKSEPPICETCGLPLTVKHIFTECRQYEDLRDKHNLTGSLAEILKDDISIIDSVIKFLKESNLWNLI